jgi:hypothetical protein
MSLAPCAYAQQTDNAWEAGRTLYYTATRQDGTAVQATVQQDVPLPPGAGACVSCHRRSGLGLAEGGERALNITGSSLFRASDVAPVRPAYDDALLMRAIVAGIDANGEKLSDLMPRYQMTADDASALAQYLRSLGTSDAPGVTDVDLYIATIITPDSTEDERLALETIIPEYVAVKNGGTRQEQRRSVASARHFYGIKRYQAHREWKHSFWYLEGEPETWRAQLQQLYKESPPFAILSGSIGGQANIVHDFCEQFQIACILPMTDVPPPTEEGFYSLYFSSGVRLEAQVIADYMIASTTTDGAGALLLYNDDPGGNTAKETVLEQLSGRDAASVTPYRIETGRVLSVLEWTRLLQASSAETLILLVSSAQLQNLMSPKLDVGILPGTIFTVEAITDWSHSPIAPAVANRVMHVYPYSLPVPGRTHFPREDVWLKTRGIKLADDITAAKVLFACKAFGMALADIQSNFTREYLLESLEHALDSSFLTSLYPRTTLGPDQRFLSRGAYLTSLVDRQGQIVVTNGSWIQP